jgi:DUF3037 family protein
MSATKGYYSIIQCCPDLGRFEAANVGVLLFCPETAFLQAMTTLNNSRIIRFFGSAGHDWRRINEVKRGLRERLAKEQPEIKTVEDLRTFISLRANLMQITEPLPIKVIDPEKELQSLFEQIIGEPARGRTRGSLRSYVARTLSGPELVKKVVRDVPVTVPALEKQVEFPFGFQDGRFNLINPVRFAAHNPDQWFATASKYAVEGRSLYQHPDPALGDLQLIVVGQFRAKDDQTPVRVQRVFDEYGVRLLRIDDLPKLVNEIRTTGKEINEAVLFDIQLRRIGEVAFEGKVSE